MHCSSWGIFGIDATVLDNLNKFWFIESNIYYEYNKALILVNDNDIYLFFI